MKLAFALAAAAAVALVASALPGEITAPAQAAAPAVAPTKVRGSIAGVETLGPIAVQKVSGPLVAELPPSVATLPDGKVFNPQFPFLYVPDRKDDASVDVKIFDVSIGQASSVDSNYVWSGALNDGWARITTTLVPGHGYAVFGFNPEAATWQALGSFVVAASSKRSGPSVSSGGISSSVITGEVQWGWGSPSLPAPTDGVAVGLSWVARQQATPGLPTGWKLGVNNGSPWATLTEFGAKATRAASEPGGCDSIATSTAPSAVFMSGWDGTALTFERNESGIYQQVMGGVAVPGFSNTLSLCGGSERVWKFTDVEGMVTEFRNGRAVSVVAQDQPTARMKWNGDRLVEVVASSDRSIKLLYSGNDACPSSTWGSGFAPPPSGMLCQIRYPGGQVTDFGYVATGLAAPQIALIKDPGNQGTSLGWDSVGRLVSTRAALVNQAATVNPDAKGVLARVEYDAKGRGFVLKDAPASVGGNFITNRITFPPITETTITSADPLQASVASVGGGFDMGITYWIDSRTYESLKSRDKAQAVSASRIDPETGQVVGTVDPLGRETTYKTDATGSLISEKGPFIVNPSQPSRAGMEQQISYDTTPRNGKDVAIQGFKVDVFQGPKFLGDIVERQYWKPRAFDAGLDVVTPAKSAPYSARLTTKWTPAKADDEEAAREGVGGWKFEIANKPGLRFTVMIGPVVCPLPGCTIPNLASGPKQITIEMSEIPAAGGSVSIKASPANATPVLVPATQVEPGFQRATHIEFNDTYAGSVRAPAVDVGYDNPAVESPTTYSAPGGIKTTMKYEPSNPAADQWGRQISTVSPGGQVQETTYWPSSGQIAEPSLCGTAMAEMSGQKRTVTRVDGMKITTYYDISGRPIAQVLTGDSGRTQTSCMEYLEDGSLRSASVWNNSGALLERTTVEPAVDGDPLTLRTTVQHGPAAPVEPGVSVTTVTTVNLRGLPVRYIDESGTTTLTTYTVLDDQASVSMQPPNATRPTITSTYDYRPVDGQLTRVVVNDRVAAEVTYKYATGRVEDITYAAGTIAQSLSYAPSGQPSGLVSSGGDYDFRQTIDYTVFGRIRSVATSQLSPSKFTEDRSYEYDAARRMTKVLISTTTNGVASADTNYRYDYADAQDASCGASTRAYPNAGADILRTGGSRAGVPYVSCHNDQGRLVSTTDPLMSGDATGKTKVALTHDAGGRVRTITGGARSVELTWGADTALAIMKEGAGADAVTTTLSRFGERILTKTVKGSAGISTVKYAYGSPLDTSPTIILQPNGAVDSYTIGLPGGANVTVPIGGAATVTLSGIDGAALGTIPAPSFNATSSGPDTAPATVGLALRFGAYGEPLQLPSTAAGSNAAPNYTWQATQRQETLEGTSAITLVGARPYLPALGEFLAPDPNFQASNNLYSYTPGDPVNGSDRSGEANEWSWFWQVVSCVVVVASFVVGAVTGGWLIPLGLGFAATAAQILSAKTQEEESPGLNVFRQVQFWAQTVATIAYVGFYAAKGLYYGVKWIGKKAGWGWATKTKAAATQPSAAGSAGARDSVGSLRSSRSSINLMDELGLAPAEAVVKTSKFTRFAAMINKANPRSNYWRMNDGSPIPGRSYLRSLGKLSGHWAVFGGGYGFQKWAEGYQPSS